MATTRRGAIKIRRSDDGKQFYSVITGKNGQVLYTSETMKRKLSVVNCINATCDVFYEHGYTFVDESIPMHPKPTKVSTAQGKKAAKQ